MRMAALPSSGDTPIAPSTCEGVMLPLWHAEPLEQATPCRSSAISIDSLSVPGTERLSMCGARGAPRPCTTASGTRSSSEVSRRSRRASRRAHSASFSFSVSSMAVASAMAIGTFSVPGRRPRSCVPPKNSGASGVPRRTYIAPMHLGAPNLCPLTDNRSNGVCLASTTSLPNAWTASV